MSDSSCRCWGLFLFFLFFFCIGDVGGIGVLCFQVGFFGRGRSLVIRKGVFGGGFFLDRF